MSPERNSREAKISLNGLVEQAHESFKQKEFFINSHGDREAHGPKSSVKEVIDSFGIEDEFDLLKKLSCQTEIKPLDLDLGSIKVETFQEFIRGVSSSIIELELVDRYPEIWDEYTDRFAKFSSEFEKAKMS